jgi:hypothetical protein
MNRNIRLAYLAGALDGDGSFSLIKGTSHSSVSPLYYPCIQLANANKEIVDLFSAEFNGGQGMRKSYIGKDGSKRSISHYWRLDKAPRCLPLLEAIVDYLIVKKQRAEFLRDYIINNPFVRGSNKLSDALLVNREKSYLKMRSFNDTPCTNGALFSLSHRKDSADELFWSYVAGLMDTDGSFSLKRENRTTKTGSVNYIFCPMVLLTMADCRAIYCLMNNFIGGSMFVVKAKTATNGFCYRFSINSKKNVQKFLERIIPFLCVKKEAAIELLNFCKTKFSSSRKKGLSADEILFRETVYEKIKELNYGVYKSSLIDLKLLPGDAGDNKAQAAKACSVNVASEKTSKEDAVL